MKRGIAGGHHERIKAANLKLLTVPFGTKFREIRGVLLQNGR